MKKHLRFGVLLATVCTLVACQEGLSISSSIESSSTIDSSFLSSSFLFSSSQSSNSSSKKDTYYPIGPTSNISLLSSDLVFSLTTPTITKEQAEDLVINDIFKCSNEQSLHKKTCITSKKRESHVTKNRSTATYSVKDLIEEKHSINQIDSDSKWYYSKTIENTITTYFVEDTLYRHQVRENLYFMKDGFFYQVHAEQSYYEGMEDRGTYKAYYYKIPDEKEENNIGYVTLHIEDYVYFNDQLGFDKIDRTILTNFANSSSFYYSPGYSDMDRHPTYEFHSSGEKGNFGCIATDDYDYRASDLNDCPSMEKDELSTISYHQDYLLNNINYFSYNEDYLTKSISKSGIGVVIREETTRYRKKVIEECEIFYPDLSKFEEKEYNPTTR